MEQGGEVLMAKAKLETAREKEHPTKAEAKQIKPLGMEKLWNKTLTER